MAAVTDSAGTVDQPQLRSRTTDWPLVSILFCVWGLMVFTVSPPRELGLGGGYGVASILPPSLLRMGKLCMRMICLGLLSFSLISTMKNRGTGRLLFLFAPLILFAVWGISSTLWSPLKTVSLQQSGTFAILILFAYVLATRWNVAQTSTLFFHISLALLTISAGLLFLNLTAPQYGALTRNASGLFHSTSAGSTASLGVVIIVGSAVLMRWSWCGKLIVPALVLHVSVLLIAGNRLSIALAGLAVIVCLFFFLKKNELAIGMIVIGVLGISYLCLDPKLNATEKVVDKVEHYSRQGQKTRQLKSISGREEMWAKIWKSYQKSPWIGHGYFVTSETGRIYVWNEWGNWTAHNLYLQVLATTGVVGAIIFLMALLVPAAGLGLLLIGCEPNQRRSIFLLLLMGGWYLGWGLLNESILGPLQPETVIFAVAYGISIAMLNHRDLRSLSTASTVD